MIRIIIQDKESLKTEEVIHKIERDYLQFKIKTEDKVAMVGQQQTPKKTGKCYNCDIVGHSAKDCRKPWTNYKYAPPRANLGETEGVSVSFIAMKDDYPEDREQDVEMSFYDPMETEMEIFGNLGNDGFYSQSDIEYANKRFGHQAMTGVVSANNTSTVESSIISDSGASDHMFNNQEDFTNYIEHKGKVEIGEVGRSVEIVGKGDVVLNYQNNTVTLRNA